jgi:hypothetical protein
MVIHVSIICNDFVFCQKGYHFFLKEQANGADEGHESRVFFVRRSAAFFRGFGSRILCIEYINTLSYSRKPVNNIRHILPENSYCFVN